MDITIIGAGPGGYEAAIYASKLGAQVTLVEQRAVGGTCLNVGCIPTKALLAAKEALDTVKTALSYGIHVEGGCEARLTEIIARKDKVVDGLVKGVEYTLEAAGVKLLRGRGTIAGETTVEVTLPDGGKEVVQTDAIILATGSCPAVPGFIRTDGQRVITSDEILAQTEPPQSLLILGGGVIGCEIGQFLSAMGTQVTILEMEPHLLPHEDQETAKALERQFRKDKIKVLCGKTVTAVETTNGGVAVTLEGDTQLEAAQLLVAVGRRPNTRELGLERVSITPDKRGYIPVDKHMHTGMGKIYAIGDIVATPQLAHVAAKEGFAAVDHILGRVSSMTYHAVPRCVYTQPEVAAVGLTESALQRAGTPYHKGSFSFTANGKAKAAGHTDGFVTVLADDNDILVGACVVGHHATELLQVLTLGVQQKLTATAVGDSIFPHPTMSEAIMEALHDVHGMSVHKVSITPPGRPAPA